MRSLALALFLAASPALAVDVRVDVTQDRHPISPDIYGINSGDDAQLARMGITVRRWGDGNPATRYNWKTLMANRARDWYFQSIPNSQGNSDTWVDATVRANVTPIIPLTTIGWISKGDGTRRYCGYSVAKYGAQLKVAPDNSDCGNGLKPGTLEWQSIWIDTRPDPTDTSFAADHTWAAEWVAHLAPRGVHLYALDNEPGIWNSTHHDVHPDRTTYAEMKNILYAYAPAVKAVDPTAKILGPVSWGWTEYVFLNWVNNNNPDHDAYGDFIPWYLDQAKAYADSHGGERILDYLDLHYYPETTGVNIFSSDVDPTTNAARLKATRSLWDPSHPDPSWIGTPVMLIPRMRDWVSAHYPGTKLALTEYSWGAIDDPVGAIAEADVLGIFGREGLDLATLFWTPNAASGGSIGEDAFKLYRNYDGMGARFGNTSVRATTTNVDVVTAYAAEVRPGKVTAVLINKDTSAATVNLTLAVTSGVGSWRAFAFGQGGRLASAGSGTAVGNTLSFTLPAYTAQLVEYTALVADADGGSLDAGTSADAGQDGGSPGGGGDGGFGCRPALDAGAGGSPGGGCADGGDAFPDNGRCGCNSGGTLALALLPLLLAGLVRGSRSRRRT